MVLLHIFVLFVASMAKQGEYLITKATKSTKEVWF
jgi:hypothetical protein